MASRKSQPLKNEIREHPLVAALVTDPENPAPLVRTVVGYAGRASEASKVRLYTRPTLDTYFEFDRRDILYHEPTYGRGPDIFWVREGAPMTWTYAAPFDTGDDFLSGVIAADAWVAAEDGDGRVGGWPTPTSELCTTLCAPGQGGRMGGWPTPTSELCTSLCETGGGRAGGWPTPTSELCTSLCAAPPKRKRASRKKGK